MLIDIFVRIEGFFKRLVLYTEVPATAAMTDVIVTIITEVLSIVAIATKEVKRGRSSECDLHPYTALDLHSVEKFVNKLLGKNDMEDALKRLDTLTMEEARMAIVENLKVTNRVDDKVDKVDDKVDRVDGKVDRVDGKVDKVDGKVEKMDEKVDKVDEKVDKVDDRVSKVGDKVGDKVDKVDNKVTVLIDGEKKFPFGYLLIPDDRYG